VDEKTREWRNLILFRATCGINNERSHSLDSTVTNAPITRGWELMVIEEQEFSQLPFPGQTRRRVACMRVDGSWLDITAHVAKTLVNCHQNFNQIKVDESW
jgi:hypothetical protein